MELTDSESQVLDEFLDSFDGKILLRGEKLFEEGHVKFTGKDISMMNYEFRVKGSKIQSYKVTVCLDEELIKHAKSVKMNMASDCECIYFEENQICKHVAAAYLYLEYHSDLDPLEFENRTTYLAAKPSKMPEASKSLFPLQFSCREGDLENLSERLPFINTPAKHRDIIEVELIDNGFRYLVYLGGYPIYLLVKFDPINEQILITCSDKRPFLQDQAILFLQLHWKHSTNVDLKLLSNSQRKKAKLAKLSELGMLDELKNPEKALELQYFHGGFQYIYSGELQGLFDVHKLGAEFKDFSTKELNVLDADSLSDSAKSKEYGVYNVGIAVSINEYGVFYNLFPFVAKGKKHDPAGFDVRFEILEDPDDLRLSKNEGLDQLMNSIKLMKSYLERKKFESLHKLFLDLVTSVGDEYPFFRSVDERYYGKFHKKDIKGRLEFQFAELEFLLVRNKLIFELQVWIVIGEERLNMAESQDEFFISSIFAVWKERVIILFENFNTLTLLKYWMERVPARFMQSKFPEFAENVIKPLSAYAKITDETGMITEVDLGNPTDRELYISELSGLVIFEPKLKYSTQISSNPLRNETIFDSETTSFYLRNVEQEGEFVDFLLSLHPGFTKSGNKGYFYLKHTQFTDGNWFLETFELLKTSGVKVFGLDKLTVKRYSPFKPSIAMNVNSNSDWFEINTELKFGDYQVRLKDIKQAIQSDERYVRLGDGSLGQIPDKWLRKFRKLIQSSDTVDDNLKLSKIHFSLLADFEDEIVNPEVEKELEEKKNRLKSFEEIRKVKVPKTIKADLRNYQKAGLNWLNFLQDYGWGGILADDMGLGKTLQVITLISQMAEKGTIHVLIVAPTTLLFNWKNELEKFAPHLDYFIHHGDRSDNIEELKAHTIVLTSYGLVNNDLDLLTQLEFDLIIADESQAIKNVSSLRYKSIIKLRGKLKLAMTGTPIENGIAELFAHMNFVNPGFFRTFSGFKDQYIKELRNGNPEVMEDLRKKIQPFVLRRTKEEVLTELPDKIEEYLYCEMGAAQKKVYEAYRNEYRDFLQGKFDESGASQSKLYVLEGLTKLRLICDSPDLINKEKEGAKSAKIDMLLEHIVEKTGNHKILIFSQFVKMLDLVKAEMNVRNIPFSYLDGKSSMKDRENSVNEFQEDTSIRVFLISLKAGGTGLNLTAADYVYILDPWWNPAVENQAIDRCYRMGQVKKVMAYRMICKDTVEEKIMELQKSKLKLAKDVISEGDGFLTGMNGDTMLKLFE